MKKFLVFILLGLLITGCSKNSKEKKTVSKDTTAVKITPVKNPNLRFLFRYKFEKDKHYNYKMAVFTEDKQTIKSDSMFTNRIKQSLIYQMDIGLNKVDKDSVLELTCNINSILLDAVINGEFFSYRSGSKLDSTDRMKYAQYEAIVNSPFSVSIGKNGGILEIFHVDKAVGKFLQLRDAEKNASVEMRNTIRKDIVDGALKPLVTQLFREMTPKTVAKDSSWTYVQPPTPFLIFKLENTNIYKIDNIQKYNNDTVAEIEAGLHTVFTGKTKYEQKGAVYNFKKPETSVSGKIYFNISQGLIQKSNVQTKLNIFYTMELPTPKGKRKGTKTEEITSRNVVELL